jgi:Kef-type K+ transport system membrane component KefB
LGSRQRHRAWLRSGWIPALALAGVVLGRAGSALASAGSAGHEDPFAGILFALALVVTSALLGRWLAARLGMASVVGELVIGVAVGNALYQLGDPLAVVLMHSGTVNDVVREAWLSGRSIAQAAQQVMGDEKLVPGTPGAQVIALLGGPDGPRLFMLMTALWIFSSFGVILLLFLVGLESTIEGMLQVGGRAAAVAAVGIAAPFALGWATSLWLLPDEAATTHLFHGAALTATSVGITARVFKDLGRLQSDEARVILGAAVIDDVLGLVILAIVVGIVATGRVELDAIARIALLSAAFLGAVLWLGEGLARRVVRLFAALERSQVKLLMPLVFGFLLAWAANEIGLASIVGAFAAGLVLRDELFEDAGSEARTLHEMLAPLESIFAPVFFVLMGMQVDLGHFREPATLALGGAFVAAAIAGKLAVGLAAGPGVDKLSIGIGMVPRGEVGLIFASIGKSLGVIDDAVFSAVVLMVITTTLVAPVGLGWSLRRGTGAGAAS